MPPTTHHIESTKPLGAMLHTKGIERADSFKASVDSGLFLKDRISGLPKLSGEVYIHNVFESSKIN